MKKFLTAFLCFLLCSFLLVGCGQTKMKFELSPSTLDVMDFYNNVRSEYKDFFDYTTKKEEDDPMEEDTPSPLKEKELLLYYDSINKLNEENQNIFMILPVIDFMSDSNEPTFAPYLLQKLLLGYEVKYFLIRNENFAFTDIDANIGDNNNIENPFFPAVEVDKDLTKDNGMNGNLESEIAKWGNVIKFNYTYDGEKNLYKIEAEAGFNYSSAKVDNNNFLEEDGHPLKKDGYSIYLINKNDEDKTITIVYEVGETVYSKVIEFKDTEKTIKEYEGSIYKQDEEGNFEKDIDGHYVEEELIPVFTYKYQYQPKSCNMLGVYEITYEKDKGYLYSKHTKNDKTVVIIQSYVLAHKMNIIRLHSYGGEGAKLIIIDYYLAPNGIEGKIKYVETTGNTRSIENFEDLSYSSYATFLESDKQGKDKISAFDIQNKKVTCKSVKI